MKISIITPAYNCEKYIEKCITSVKDQDYKDIEHIIIDDGSKDNTLSIIKKYLGAYNLRYETQENHGIAYTMNKGFSIATGDVFAWLDADNYYEDGILDQIAKNFSEHSPDIIFGNIYFVDTQYNRIGLHKPPNDIDFNKALIHTTGSIPLQPAVFFKKEIFKKTGGFNTRFKIAGDYEFWLNVLKNKPTLHYLDIAFGSYTLVQSGISQSFKGVRNGLKEMFIISKRYNQPLYGKFMMVYKYAKGFIGKLIR